MYLVWEFGFRAYLRTSSLSLREFAWFTVPLAQWGKPDPPAYENYPTFASKFLPGSSDPALTGRGNSTRQSYAGLTGNCQAQLCKELLSWAAAAWDARVRNPSGMGCGTQLSPVCGLHCQGHTRPLLLLQRFRRVLSIAWISQRGVGVREQLWDSSSHPSSSWELNMRAKCSLFWSYYWQPMQNAPFHDK